MLTDPERIWKCPSSWTCYGALWKVILEKKKDHFINIKILFILVFYLFHVGIGISILSSTAAYIELTLSSLYILLYWVTKSGQKLYYNNTISDSSLIYILTEVKTLQPVGEEESLILCGCVGFDFDESNAVADRENHILLPYNCLTLLILYFQHFSCDRFL